MKKTLKRTLALLLALIMLFPGYAFAEEPAEADVRSETSPTVHFDLGGGVAAGYAANFSKYEDTPYEKGSRATVEVHTSWAQLEGKQFLGFTLDPATEEIEYPICTPSGARCMI